MDKVLNQSKHKATVKSKRKQPVKVEPPPSKQEQCIHKLYQNSFAWLKKDAMINNKHKMKGNIHINKWFSCNWKWNSSGYPLQWWVSLCYNIIGLMQSN